MKNIILIHGYNGIPKIYMWLKEKLEEKGYLTIVPQFPAQEGVIYDIWTKILDTYKNYINEETIIIAHSIGNEFIIKYLAENRIKINLYISLAGFADKFETEGKEDLNRAIKEFLITEKEIEIFNGLVNKKYSIYSDNDHIVPFESLEKYPKVIGAKSILISGIGHMGKKSGLETIPEVLEIINMNNKNISIQEMMDMQMKLWELNKEKWSPMEAKYGRNFLLWMIEEMGEAISIIKKKGDNAIMNNEEVRKAFVEEMSDILMYYNDTLLRYGITPDEISSAYIEKYNRNIKRNYQEEYKKIFEKKD